MTAGVSVRTRLEGRLHELPVLPTVMVHLLRLDPASATYAHDVGELIEREPNYATRVLASANSAVSAPASPITSVRTATMRLGAATTVSLVLGAGVTHVFAPRDDWERSLWIHALQVALAARALHGQLPDPGLRADELYALALLHDVGRFLIFQEAPAELRSVDEGSWDDPAALVARETAICGLNHADLGALACQRWGLPDTFADVVAGHHRPIHTVTTVAERAIAIVRAADLVMFPSATGGDDGYDRMPVDELERTLLGRLPSSLGLDATTVQRIVVDVRAESATIAAALGLV